MIQVIGLRPFIDKNGVEKKKHVLFTHRPHIEDIFNDVEKIIQEIPEAERWNVYFTALNCKDPDETGRKLRRFRSQKTIPIDIDGIDVEKIDQYLDIFFKTLPLSREKTGIVFSGNGLQFIVELTQPFDDIGYFDQFRLHYQALCTKLDAAFRKESLPSHTDPSVWSAARLMRFPNTENRKPGKKGVKHAKLLQGVLEPQIWNWEQVTNIPEIGKEDHVEWIPSKSPQLDNKAMFAGCNFLKWIIEHPEEIREPHFYAASSIIARMENGNQFMLNVAKTIAASGSDSTVAGYSDSEVQSKIDQSVQASGPRTCKNINSVWGKCKECPNFAKVTCPVQIKGPDFIATKDTGFYNWMNGKPSPAHMDLLKFYDSKGIHKTLKQNGLVYKWNGTHYTVESDTSIKCFAQDNFSPSPSIKIVNEFAALVRRTNSVEDEFFNNPHGFINMKNGVLEIKTGELLTSHSPERGFKYCLPYSYDEDAQAPRFDSFLDEITGGNKEKRKTLEEWGGYAISGAPYNIHKCLLLLGEGRNGKSKFIEALQLVAGHNNYSNVTLSDLSNINSRQLLEGKLFNVAEEIAHREMRDTLHLKALSSGARVQVKLMWNQPYFIESVAKLIFAANTLPPTNDTSLGFKERMCIVTFDQTFIGKNADTNLLAKFRSELPGIFNIFLEGYKRLVAQGHFTISDSSADILKTYTEDNNPVAYWLSETNVVKVNPLNGKCTFETVEDLHREYSSWVIEQGSAAERTIGLVPSQFGKLFASALPEGVQRASRKRCATGVKRGFWDVELIRSGMSAKNGVASQAGVNGSVTDLLKEPSHDL